MEPNDLKPTPPDEAALEAWLRTSAALPPLPDDGFSRRVLAALPPAPRSSRRILFCLAGAFVGAVVAAFPFFHVSDLPALNATLLHTLEQLAQPAVGIALGLTLASLGYVFWSELRRLVRV